jgi:hypothetical protein
MLDAAMQWPIRLVQRETETGHLMGHGVTQTHLTCHECGQSVCCLGTGGGSYALTGQIIVSGILAHLKISHQDALPRT